MRRALGWLVVLCVGLAPWQFGVAGEDSKLERVESKASTSSSSSSSSSSSASTTHTHYYGSYGCSSFLECVLWLFLNDLFSGVDSNVPMTERYSMLKREYHPALPTARVEGAYHKVIGDDVQGYHLNATLGYLSLGADLDWIHYLESDPATQLKVISPHFLYRMTFGGIIQVDIALGAKILRGRQTNAGFEFGLPIYLFPNKHIIIDLKTYASTINRVRIGDFSGGISGKWKLGGIRAGYRLLNVGGEKMHGPEVGMFVQF